MSRKSKWQPRVEPLDPRVLLSTSVVEHEPNGRPSQATEVRFDPRDGSADLLGAIRTRRDLDLFHFHVDNPGGIQLFSNGSRRFRGTVTVIDGAGRVLLGTQPSRGLNAGLFNVAAGQDVFVQIRTASRSVGPYDVRLTFTAASTETPVVPTETPIGAKYGSLGGSTSFLGATLAPEQTTADGIGRYQQFQGGVIYWTPATGAHEVHGDILGKWAGMGAERSPLGYPISDEVNDGLGGRISHFQHADIDWSPATGAFEVHGDILAKWNDVRSRGWGLGHPISDEADAQGGGRVSHFQYGDIYWTPATGAHEVHADILAKWASLRSSGLDLGFPLTDVLSLGPNGSWSQFQGGYLMYRSGLGAHAIYGAFLDVWKQLLGTADSLGYPDSDVQPDGDGWRQTFQNGFIRVDRYGNATWSHYRL